LRIQCGLDDAAVREAVHQALSHVNVADLLTLARNGQLAEQAELRDLGNRLGVDTKQLSAALTRVANEPAAGVPPDERLADIIVGSTVVTVTSAVVHNRAVPAPASTSDLVQEAERIVANCSAVGKYVNAKAVDIHCGPSEAEIQALVSQVIAQTDPATLVRSAMAGNTDAPQIAALASQLRLTNASVAAMLARIGQSPVAGKTVAEQFAALARQHMDIVLRASALPVDNPAIAVLREQALEALGRGDEKRAELLLAAADLARSSIAMETPSALTVAAQADDRGKELLRQYDYTGAARVFEQAARKVPDDLPLVRAAYLLDQAKALNAGVEAGGDRDTLTTVRSLYHHSFDDIAVAIVELCSARFVDSPEEYSATSNDQQTSTLSCGPQTNGPN
jgi:hypothetical protein